MNLNRPDIRLSLFTLVAVLVMGLINIATPFFGDQAFFLLGAREMNEGYVLYRDFWDIKQPGIFFFFYLAGKLFGFSHIGVHLFELTCWLVFTVVMVWFLHKNSIFQNSFLNYLIPLIIVGTYYSVSSLRSMTQVEVLVNFPVMLVLIFNTLYRESKKYALLWLFMSGFSGGIVLLFKMIFAPVLVVLWLILFLKEFQIKNALSLFFRSGIVFAGIILAWLPFVIYCFHNNIQELCYHTFINMPPMVLKYGQSKFVSDLLHSLYSFFSKIVLLVPLVVYSLFLIRKRPFAPEMWGWLLAGFMVVFMQKNSWYSYHFQLLYTPVVFLAFIAVDFLISGYRFQSVLAKKAILVTFLLILNSVPIYFLGRKVVELSRFNFVLTANDRLNFALSQKDNAAAYRIAGHLSGQKNDCSIFVVNDPLVYYYANRNQSTAQSGWSMQLFIPGQLELLHRELIKSKPCYIFLRRSFDPFFNSEGSEILKWINQNYVKSFSGDDGTWYKSM